MQRKDYSGYIILAILLMVGVLAWINEGDRITALSLSSNQIAPMQAADQYAMQIATIAAQVQPAPTEATAFGSFASQYAGQEILATGRIPLPRTIPTAIGDIVVNNGGLMIWNNTTIACTSPGVVSVESGWWNSLTDDQRNGLRGICYSVEDW